MPVGRTNRRAFVAAFGGVAAWTLAAQAQGASKVRKVGFLYPGPLAGAPPRIAAVVSGLRAGGFREPEDVQILARITEGDTSKLAPMAADLVGQGVDLIVAVGPAAVRAMRAATSTIPIVASDLESDPVKAGFVVNVARPGSNLTGTFLDFPDFGKKWLEVLKEAQPKLGTVAVFWDPTTGDTQINAVSAAAKTLDVRIAAYEMRGRPDVDGAFAFAREQHADALLILSSPFVGGNTKLFAERCLAQRLPAVTLFPDFARDGGLMAYGPNLLAFFRQQGILASKILKGQSPADLPIETPTKFEFVLNLKTARLLDVAIPPVTLLRADEVIE
jgi:putative tryptophan/tyrosine transport system substrate-binding protein